MKVCMSVHVCIRFRRQAGHWTHTSHHPKICHGLLISPGLGTKPGGNPKC